MRVLVVVLWTLVMAGCEQSATAFKQGDVFPTFMMKDDKGNDISSEVLRGKAVVLNIWATWCGPCRQELPSLQRLSETLDNQRIVVVGVALEDDRHLVREYLNEKGIRYRNYLNGDEGFSDGVLGLKVVPATYLLDPNGRVKDVILGPRKWDDPALVRQIQAVAIR